MGFQKPPGSSAGREQEVGKVKGEQDRAEEEEDKEGVRGMGKGGQNFHRIIE